MRINNYDNHADIRNRAYQHMSEDSQDVQETLQDIMNGVSEEFFTYPTNYVEFRCDH
jgi:hypothetical protein